MYCKQPKGREDGVLSHLELCWIPGAPQQEAARPQSPVLSDAEPVQEMSGFTRVTKKGREGLALPLREIGYSLHALVPSAEVQGRQEMPRWQTRGAIGSCH